MLTAIGRAAAQRLVLRAASLAAVPRSQSVVVRAAARRGLSTTQWARLAARASTTKAKPTAKKAAATKKAAPKKKAAPAKKKAAPAKKPKAAAKKAVKKKKPVLGRPKKELTPEEKLKADVRAWKKEALLGEPKGLPTTAWTVYVAQEVTGQARTVPIGEFLHDVAERFKNLSSDEIQRLQQKAEENTLASNAAYKAWVESHTPSEVADANRIRTRIRKATGKKKPYPIRDERQPKKNISAYTIFYKAKWGSGEFANVGPVEALRAVAEQWKTLSPSEKRTYEDLAKADHDRYEREVQSVLGRSLYP